MVATILLILILVKQQVQVRDSLRLAMGPLAQMDCWEALGCSVMAAGIPPAMVCIIYGDGLAAVRRRGA